MQSSRSGTHVVLATRIQRSKFFLEALVFLKSLILLEHLVLREYLVLLEFLALLAPPTLLQ